MVRTRVAQHLHGAPAPFLLTDEDSSTDEEASPTKRKRRSIKSGKLRTNDTHVLHRIKWPHEMVCSAQSKAPVYEEMSLASFTNGYLGIVAEERGSQTGEMMLRHLRALLQDVDVYGWRVVREYHAAWLQPNSVISMCKLVMINVFLLHGINALNCCHYRPEKT